MPVDMIKILQSSLKMAVAEGDYLSAQNIRASIEAYKLRIANQRYVETALKETGHD
jgi:hypothetical protein